MRIRWKFLILLLCISLIPMLTMRWLGQRSMRELGNDLATRTSDVLIRETSLELKNLVEEHATILRRERDLIEMALNFQASRLENLFNFNSIQKNLKSKNNSAENSTHSIEGQPSAKHFMRMGMMGYRPLAVSFKNQTYRFPPNLGEQEISAIAEKTSAMISVYRSLERQHPDLILWQLTKLQNGTHMIYPAVQRLPMMQNYFNSEWYQTASEKKGIVWSKPEIDPITMQIVFTVSTPFYQPDGSLIGVTAIAVPVDELLQEDEHIRKLSKSITSLLVRPDTRAGSEEPGIRVVARENVQKKQHHHWRALSSDEWFNIGDKQQLDKIATDLQSQTTGVREIVFQDRESLVAYGCIDDYHTALLIIVPKEDIVAEAVAMESYVRSRIGRQIKVTSIMLSLVIFLVIGLALFFSRSVTKNISKLVNAVRHIASGDFNTRVNIKSRDEIGELGKTFNRMIPELEERLAMKQALDVAMEVQQNLLPKEKPIVQGLDIAGRSIYCDETGGDFYDFLEICCGNPDRIGIAVGDVSGHGISAALLMASVRAFFRSRVMQPGSISEIVTDVNGLVAEDTDETGHFMTLFYAEIDPIEETIRWVRAGHDPALVYDAENERFEELRGEGVALGVERQIKYEENSITGLSKGQIFMVGTDGLWETRNKGGEMFGKERLKALIRRNAQSSAEEILSSIINALNDFRNPLKQEDDVTLVVVKIMD